MDVSSVAFLVARSFAASAAVGCALAGYLVALWYVFPAIKRRSP